MKYAASVFFENLKNVLSAAVPAAAIYAVRKLRSLALRLVRAFYRLGCFLFLFRRGLDFLLHGVQFLA